MPKLNSNFAFVDLTVRISAAQGAYRATITDGPTGVGTYHEFTTPLSREQLMLLARLSGRSAPRRSVDSPEFSFAKDIGSKLFSALFSGDTLVALREGLELRSKEDAGLRINLDFSEAGPLLNYPWELLYNASDRRFLAMFATSPIVRYLNLGEPPKPVDVALPLRVLCVVSNPEDIDSRLDVETEWGGLVRALEPLVERGVVSLARVQSPTLIAVEEHLEAHGDYEVFHFIGHGKFDSENDEGTLLFEERRRADPITGDVLSAILRDHGLRLAVLNACEGGRTSYIDPFAGVAQSLVYSGFPSVIAMQFAISDRAALGFSSALYDGLTRGLSVDVALSRTRKKLLASGSALEWATPVLYTRVRDGVLFHLTDHGPAQAAKVIAEREPGKQESRAEIAEGYAPETGKADEDLRAQVEARHQHEPPEPTPVIEERRVTVAQTPTQPRVPSAEEVQHLRPPPAPGRRPVIAAVKTRRFRNIATLLIIGIILLAALPLIIAMRKLGTGAGTAPGSPGARRTGSPRHEQTAQGRSPSVHPSPLHATPRTEPTSNAKIAQQSSDAQPTTTPRIQLSPGPLRTRTALAAAPTPKAPKPAPAPCSYGTLYLSYDQKIEVDSYSEVEFAVQCHIGGSQPSAWLVDFSVIKSLCHILYYYESLDDNFWHTGSVGSLRTFECRPEEGTPLVIAIDGDRVAIGNSTIRPQDLRQDRSIMTRFHGEDYVSLKKSAEALGFAVTERDNGNMFLKLPPPPSSPPSSVPSG